jgi:hypothetical protein
MKLTRSALLLLLSSGFTLADPSPEAQAFLAVPQADPACALKNEKSWRATELPKGLRETIDRMDWGGSKPGTPEILHGYTMDLNKDGRDEYLLENRLGGSGGQGYFIFSDHGKTWKLLLSLQGSLYVISHETGWPEIITTSRGGGDNFVKIHHEFRDGLYQKTLIERFTRGLITEEKTHE